MCYGLMRRAVQRPPLAHPPCVWVPRRPRLNIDRCAVSFRKNIHTFICAAANLCAEEIGFKYSPAGPTIIILLSYTYRVMAIQQVNYGNLLSIQ